MIIIHARYQIELRHSINEEPTMFQVYVLGLAYNYCQHKIHKSKVLVDESVITENYDAMGKVRGKKICK